MEGGPPIFGQDFSGPALLEDVRHFLPVRGCHPLWPAVPGGSGSVAHATGLVRVRSPLLAESLLMSFPPATEMFQFAGFASALPPITLKAWGCPIRRSSDQRVLPPPRSLSQGATSFIASRCQGIHQMPFSSLESPRSTIRKHTNARPAHVRGPRTSGSRPEDHLLAITRSLRIRRQGTDARKGSSPSGHPIRRCHPQRSRPTKATHRP